MSTPIVTVYVGNLAPTVDEGALGTAFAAFGPIANIQVPSPFPTPPFLSLHISWNWAML